MKIIVTGGGGFLGQHLVKRLVQIGHEVYSFSRKAYPELEKIGITCIQGDISKEEDVILAFQGKDFCFHVASYVSMWGKWSQFFDINVLGTKNVIKACKINQIQHMVYTSTPSVAFGDSSLENVTEKTPYPKKHLSDYARSKSMAERLVLSSNSDDFSTLSLRPHLIFGPGDENLIPRVIDKAKNHKLKMIGDGENIVDVLYVENAVDAHILAFQKIQDPLSNVQGEAYFLGQGPVKLWDFINDVLKRSNLSIVKSKIPFWFCYLLGFIMESVYSLLSIYDKEPAMTRFVALQLSHSHYFNHHKAKVLLGWEPKVSINEALDKTIQS